ncbi:MAG: amidohydrolase family protein, partial [Candidatus Rokuibacteriota bacterium]
MLPLLLGAAVTVVQAGVLIDGTGAPPKRRQAIVIEGGRIKVVGDAAAVSSAAGATLVDLSAHTVLPGLIDSHTHVFLQGEEAAEGGYDANILQHGLAYRAARATVAARRALEQGFTT